MYNKATLITCCLIMALCAGCSNKQPAQQDKPQERSYDIEQYSGGKLIGSYVFKGDLHQVSANTYRWEEDDSIIEVSGDFVIISK